MNARQVRYVACGAVVVDRDQVLVLRRTSREEVRLPKGHIEPGESFEEAAVRELAEEAGYENVSVDGDLGEQIVSFDNQGVRWTRTERYFLMSLTDGDRSPSRVGETEFEPMWTSFGNAIVSLTFEAEREWVRRALNRIRSLRLEPNEASGD